MWDDRSTDPPAPRRTSCLGVERDSERSIPTELEPDDSDRSMPTELDTEQGEHATPLPAPLVPASSGDRAGVANGATGRERHEVARPDALVFRGLRSDGSV